MPTLLKSFHNFSWLSPTLFRRKQQERATVLCRRGAFALRAGGERERGRRSGQVERYYFSPLNSVPFPSHPYTTFIPISFALMSLQSIPYSRSLLSLHGHWNYSFAKGHRRSSSYGSDPATSGLSGTMGEKRGNSFQNLQSRPLSHEEYYCEYSTFYWFPRSINKCQKESVKQATLSREVLPWVIPHFLKKYKKEATLSKGVPLWVFNFLLVPKKY